MRIPPTISKEVVFIGIVPPDGIGLYYRGTGFIVGIDAKSEEYPDSHGGIFHYLVTARHVIESIKGLSAAVRINLKSGGSSTYHTDYSEWHFHSDPAVDVAVASLRIPKEIDIAYHPEVGIVDESMIAAREIGPGDDIIVIGMFGMMTGRNRNLPIIRTGTIAMMPDEPVNTRMGETMAFLIEARSISGLSGSPVYYLPLFTAEEGRIPLLGLIHGHFDVQQSETNDVIKEDLFAEGSMNVGIAIVTPGYRLLELLNSEILVQNRNYGLRAYYNHDSAQL